MKERAVLTLEVYRQHGGLCLLDQPGRESLPGQFLGLASGMFGGCTPARREHHDRYAVPQQASGRVAGLKICFDCCPGRGGGGGGGPLGGFVSPVGGWCWGV